MGTSALAVDERVKDVEVNARVLRVKLMDGRAIEVPLSWYPRLKKASAKQRGKWQISAGGFGIHWPDVNEDLSTAGLLRGAPAPGGKPSAAKR